MRWLLAVMLLLTACHAQTHGPKTGSIVRPPELECPRRSWAPTPEIVRRDSLALVKLYLESGVPEATADIDNLAATKGPAFFVPVMRGSLHGSDSIVYDIAGVFVLKSSVLVVKKVTLQISTIPAPGHGPIQDRSRIEILSSRIGHIQIVSGQGTVDHFIDLERGIHLLALESSGPPQTWTLDADTGVRAGQCQYWWDD